MLTGFLPSVQWSICCLTLFSLKRCSPTAMGRWSDWTRLHKSSSPPLLFLPSFCVTVCSRASRLDKEMSGRRNSADLCTANERGQSDWSVVCCWQVVFFSQKRQINPDAVLSRLYNKTQFSWNSLNILHLLPNLFSVTLFQFVCVFRRLSGGGRSTQVHYLS